MQLDHSAESSTSSRIDSSDKTINHHPTTPDLLERGSYNMRIRSMQRFIEKPRKIFQEKNLAFIMLTRPNSEPVALIWEQDSKLATVINGPDSEYHTPQQWEVFINLLDCRSHNECKRSLCTSREEIVRGFKNSSLYCAFPQHTE